MSTSEARSGDSLKVHYNEETHEMNLEWDENDPQWGFLSLMSDDDIREFVTTAITKAAEEAGIDTSGIDEDEI